MLAGSLTRGTYRHPSRSFKPSHFRLPFKPSPTTDYMLHETMQHPSANQRSSETEDEREASLKKNCLQAFDRRARETQDEKESRLSKKVFHEISEGDKMGSIWSMARGRWALLDQWGGEWALWDDGEGNGLCEINGRGNGLHEINKERGMGSRI